MPRYLFTASYPKEGLRGLLAEGGTARRAAVEKTVAELGGHLESFDFAFGGEDAYVIVELPDNRAAAAIALTVNAAGLTHLKTTVLLAPEEVDSAAQQTVHYTPPGSA
jgi:uncharacterized protein with GYD domain